MCNSIANFEGRVCFVYFSRPNYIEGSTWRNNEIFRISRSDWTVCSFSLLSTFTHLYFRGTFSVVKLALHKSSGKAYAIKIIDKRKFCREEKSQEQIKREIQILSKVSHPNIVAYKGLYESMIFFSTLVSKIFSFEIYVSDLFRSKISVHYSRVCARRRVIRTYFTT